MKRHSLQSDGLQWPGRLQSRSSDVYRALERGFPDAENRRGKSATSRNIGDCAFIAGIYLAVCHQCELDQQTRG